MSESLQLLQAMRRKHPTRNQSRWGPVAAACSNSQATNKDKGNASCMGCRCHLSVRTQLETIGPSSCSPKCCSPSLWVPLGDELEGMHHRLGSSHTVAHLDFPAPLPPKPPGNPGTACWASGWLTRIVKSQQSRIHFCHPPTCLRSVDGALSLRIKANWVRGLSFSSDKNLAKILYTHKSLHPASQRQLLSIGSFTACLANRAATPLATGPGMLHAHTKGKEEGFWYAGLALLIPCHPPALSLCQLAMVCACHPWHTGLGANGLVR